MITYLLSKSTNGKFRFACVETDEEWHEPEHGYIIQRSYGQVGGKTTLSPMIIVDKTKQKRTWKEQLQLQYNSEVKKFKDKGYVEVPKHPNEYTLNELAEIFGEVVTNQAGVIKPMLAKQESKVTNRKIFDKEWYVSRKIDGVRALLYYKDGRVHSASRGGEHYDYSIGHIIDHPKLIEWFSNNPNLILDGELYKFGVPLQTISGAARMEKDANNEWLEFYLYDIADTTKPFSERLEILNTIKSELHLDFNPEQSWKLGDLQIQFVPHTKISGEENIWNFHNDCISEGWEGCVIRDPNKPYKPNGRTNDMIKFKNYQSSEFLVIGYELGLRGSEDMTFICELEDGRTFKAMPCGDRDTKEEYVKNFDTKYKNHLAECTYFNYSDDGKPTQPKLRVFRFDLE